MGPRQWSIAETCFLNIITMLRNRHQVLYSRILKSGSVANVVLGCLNADHQHCENQHCLHGVVGARIFIFDYFDLST
jgi:hypothetical protein